MFDHFGTQLPKEVIVHIWKSVTNVTEVVADGYNVLLNVGYDATSWFVHTAHCAESSGVGAGCLEHTPSSSLVDDDLFVACSTTLIVSVLTVDGAVLASHTYMCACVRA